MRQDPFPAACNVLVPDLGVEGAEIRLNTWLVPRGSLVIPGERIAELITEGSLFQLESPAEGRLGSFRADPGETVRVGDVIAKIRLPAPPDATNDSPE